MKSFTKSTSGKIHHRCDVCDVEIISGSMRTFISATKRNNGNTYCGSCSKKKSTRGGVAYKGTPIHSSYSDAKSRCNNPKVKNYYLYGGRGIKMEWESFEDFRIDMEPTWFSGAMIERIDGDGNYNSKNCKWATRTEQNRNRSNTKLTKDKAVEIRNKYSTGEYTYKQLMSEYGLKSLGHIGRIIKGDSWK